MKKYLTLAAAIAVSGCATIVSGTSQEIHVQVVDNANNQPLHGVACTVFDGGGASYNMSTNPATITVSKGNGAIRIDCKKAGYKQMNMAVGDSFNAVTVVNVLFWPGFIVDAASGAYKSYPSHYVVSMQKQ